MCLYLTKRGATYWFRRSIPSELQPALGRSEFMLSLRTKDREEAKERRSKEAVRTDALIADARATLGQRQHSTTSPVVPMRELSAFEVEQHREDTSEIISSDDRRVAAEEEVAALRLALSGSTAEMPYELRRFKYLLEGVEFERQVLEDRLRAAQVAHREQNCGAGVSVADYKRPSAAPARGPEPASGAPMLDAEIIDLWAAERKVKPKGIDTHRAVARWFYERVGRVAVKAITRQDVLTFKGKLLEEGQSLANIKMKLSRLRTLLQYAADNGHADLNAANGVSIRDTQAAKNKRKPFDLAALNAIFNGPVHAESQRPAQGRGEAAYWMPLLALFTGARMGELGQLRPDDVRQVTYTDPDDNQRSGWFVHLTAVEDSSGDQSDGTELKNAESERLVPVHPELERLGFNNFAEAAQEQKQTRLFPLLTPGPYGKLTHKWGQWFGGYLRHTCGVLDKRMTFHSFRHTFTDYIRRPDIPEGIQRQLVGHSSKDIHDDYGSGYNLHWLVESMKLYRVPGLSLPD